MLRVAEGKCDEAWQDLLACHRLGRLVARGATLIEGLVGIAIEQIASNGGLAYLQHANLTTIQIQDRLKELQGLSPMPPMADKVNLCERCEYLDSLQLVRRHGVGMLERLFGRGEAEGEKPDADELKALEKIDWEPALRDGNRWYDRLAAAMRQKERADRKKACDKIEEDLATLKKETMDPENLAKLVLGKDPPDQTAGKEIGEILTVLRVSALYKAAERPRPVGAGGAEPAHRFCPGRLPATRDTIPPGWMTWFPVTCQPPRTTSYRESACLPSLGERLSAVQRRCQRQGRRRASYDDSPPGDDVSVRMPLPQPK